MRFEFGLTVWVSASQQPAAAMREHAQLGCGQNECAFGLLTEGMDIVKLIIDTPEHVLYKFR